jgi:hypothetical protein
MSIVPLYKAPSSAEAESIIRELVVKGAICWSKHCKERMRERDINIQQILNCLSKGRVIEEPFLNHANGGGYETAVEKITAGENLKVVVCMKFSQTLLVITAINK